MPVKTIWSPAPRAICCALALLAGPAAGQEQRPAFPGAVGFGQIATGWRGGEVMAVTSLDDAGPGTLRDCAENGDVPRICIFDVAGTITLDTPITPGSNLYIAGQTAPGQGVQLRNGKSARSPLVIVNIHDLVVRFLKLRPGPSLEPSPVVDALSIEDGERLYFGNLSLMFATDENFSLHVSDGVSADITLERSIVAYGLDNSTHPKGKHSKGALICSKEGTDNECGRVTLWGNLFAHNRDRNPDVNGTEIGPIEVVNNIFYNPISQFGEAYDLTGNLSLVYVGNVALTGPSSRPRAAWAVESLEFEEGNEITINVRDNIAARRKDCEAAGELPILDPKAWFDQARQPVEPVSVQPIPAREVMRQIPPLVGDRIDGRRDPDPLDERVLLSLVECTGKVIDSVEQAGGWPELSGPRRQDGDRDGLADDWESGREGFDPARADDPWQADLQTGLPAIEAYLAELAGDISAP
ncbi:hypothetical protein [Paracoccus sp. SCSIO 75233]|uniref:hypothetical protein n=1 Tax=Paracoccus sp. SCSIO 75233 TaxID=3017782 RepID=UPI0022F0C815|nr:hypothetical protein [Paracoccus sp. SCSIO 75233]WBU53708.1 hypothetical protein PAF12_02380 [Paracoccus sp. SCSIO 75233]